MRSVYAKMLLLSVAILILSMGGFVVISRIMTYESFGAQEPIGRNATLQFEEAQRAYQKNGPKALDAYLDLQRAAYPRLHFFFLKKGTDLVDGADRSQLLGMAKSRWALWNVVDPIMVAIPTAASESVFLVEIPREDIIVYLPYYMLLLVAVAILCWGLAFQFASPLNRLTESVRRFGNGDLTVRVHSRRHDEIGDVARAFDQMADRIESLLTSERRLLQDISHELRSPLARLSFAAELARTSPDREVAALRVNKEIDRLTALVQSLLQVTREEGDPGAHRSQAVELATLVQELVQNCEIEAAARGCNLILRGSSRVELRADPELLRRAIENIFRNAIWHAPPGSTVEIVMNNTAACASVSVRDYGPGVPPEALTKIFQPFFRVDNSRNEATGGIGLGLAIAKRAVHVHQGQIWAENAGPGLRVCVNLPLEIPVR